MRDNQPFRYYAAQREAIETLIWLYEVAQVRRHRDLLERFATAIGLHVLRYDDFARYAIKMATGSGKTKVMALAIAWQYFNAVAEGRNDLREDATRLGNHRVVPSAGRSRASSVEYGAVSHFPDLPSKPIRRSITSSQQIMNSNENLLNC